MIYTKRELPEATEELREAAFWFDDQFPPQGDELLYYIDSAITDILDDPESWGGVPEWKGEPKLHQRHTEKYHYRVIYFIDGNEVIIVAYAAERREPGYWINRITVKNQPKPKK